MSTPSGYGGKTGESQTEFAGENLACSGVAVLDRSHGHTLNHISTCRCRSCVHSCCCGCMNLYAWCYSKKVCIGCASVLGTTTEMGCVASEAENDDGASECASRHSGLCCCRHFL